MNLLRPIRVFVGRLTRTAKPRAHRSRERSRTQRSGRVAIVWFAVAALSIHGAVLLALQDPRLRDPEYGLRAEHLRERIAENPGRPVVLVIGSSRTAMGVCPAAWEEARPADPARPDPLIFNAAVLGAGPVMELMTLRRFYADGFRPDVVLIEYWPPFLHHDDRWSETRRIAVDRLLEVDRKLVRDYFPKKDRGRVLHEMNHRRRNAIYANRDRLLIQISPKWLPAARRTDAGWTNLDGWGWLPGLDLNPDLTEWRAKAVANCSDIYRPLFAKYRIADDADRALRGAIALAQANGAKVGLFYLPESSEFRGIFPPAVEAIAGEYLAELRREYGLPFIDYRTWMPDDALVDGFHMSKRGAAEFTRKLGTAVAETFAELQP